MKAKTNSEGLAGFIAFKTGVMPSVESEQFVFEGVSVDAFEELNTAYVTEGFSQVQQMVVQCGKKRRGARSSNSRKG